MNECNIEIRTVEILTNKDVWFFQLKNIGIMIILCLPLFISINFELSNKFFAIGLICIGLIIIFALFLKIGYDTKILFTSNEIKIVQKKSSYKITKEEIIDVKLIKFSGSRAPFIIEIYLKNGTKKKFSVEKFNFQNPDKKYSNLLDCQQWKDIIKFNNK